MLPLWESQTIQEISCSKEIGNFISCSYEYGLGPYFGSAELNPLSHTVPVGYILIYTSAYT